jgi:hypothetical protein
MHLNGQQWRTMSLLGMFRTRTRTQLAEAGAASDGDLRVLAAHGLIAGFVGEREIDPASAWASTLRKAEFSRTELGTKWLKTGWPAALSMLAEACTSNRMILASRFMSAAGIDRATLIELGSGGYLTGRDTRGEFDGDWRTVAAIPDAHWLGVSRKGLAVTARGPAEV